MDLARAKAEHDAKTVERDTIPSWEQLDTLPTAVHAAMTACAAHFTAATVPVSSLFNLLELSILLNDTATATAARERWLAATPTWWTQYEDSVEIRADRLINVFGLYSGFGRTGRIFPAPVEATADTIRRQLLQRLDALGPAAQQQQLKAWTRFTWDRIKVMHQLGQWDPVKTIVSVEALLKRLDAGPPEKWPIELKNPFGGEIPELLDQLVEARGYLDPHGVVGFYDSLQVASRTVAVTTQAPYKKWIATDAKILAQAGTPVTPLVGMYWFNPHGAAVWPQPNHASLLIVVPTQLVYGVGGNRQALWKMQRLAAKYGDRGLTVTLVLKTQGYWLKNGTNTGPISPSEEAADDSAYFLGYLKLPFTLVVVPTTFTSLPDGRVVQSAPVQFETAYGGTKINFPDIIMLTDRTGHLVLKDESQIDEGRLDAYIARALRQ